jgi:hypothetical protein
MSSLPITVQEPPGVQAALNSLLGTGTTAPTVTTERGPTRNYVLPER